MREFKYQIIFIIYLSFIFVFSCAEARDPRISEDGMYLTENGTNYLPIFTDRWPFFKASRFINLAMWEGGGSSIISHIIIDTNQIYEGFAALELKYTNNLQGWFGIGYYFADLITHDNLRTDMSFYSNWNLSFMVKGPSNAGTNLTVGIQSGVYGDDLKENVYTLSELGYTGSGSWEKLSFSFTNNSEIEWDNFVMLFHILQTSISNQFAGTIYIDDLYWWKKAD